MVEGGENRNLNSLKDFGVLRIQAQEILLDKWNVPEHFFFSIDFDGHPVPSLIGTYIVNLKLNLEKKSFFFMVCTYCLDSVITRLV